MDSNDSHDQSIASFYEHDHEALEESFTRYRRLKDSDFEQAKDYFLTFYDGLMTHIKWEEDIVFPIFEEKMGDGLTGTMRREHEQIQDVLESLKETLENDQVPDDHLDQKLIKFLNPHNESEEAVVYPAIDRHLSEEEIRHVFDQMDD